MPQESIWKDKEEDKPLTPRQRMEIRARYAEDMTLRCKFHDNGRCYSPFANSLAQRCRGSIGCDNFEIIW